MNNTIRILAYKSSRKNAISSDFINVHHLISKDKISDSRILDQFISTIDSFVSVSKKFNGFIELSSHVHVEKSLQYHTGAQVFGVNSIFEKSVSIPYSFPRQRFYSIENCINFIHSLYLLLYPECKLHISDIYANPSIKSIINKYYN